MDATSVPTPTVLPHILGEHIHDLLETACAAMEPDEDAAPPYTPPVGRVRMAGKLIEMAQEEVDYLLALLGHEVAVVADGDPEA
jgi:hypothetical protein